MIQQRRKRSIPLRNAFDGQRYIARLINEVHRGEIEAATGTKLVYMALGLLKFIELSAVEERLKQLEQTVKEIGNE